MNTYTHCHHTEESLLREHRLAFQATTAPDTPPPAPEASDDVPDAAPVSADAPSDDAAKAGGKREGAADAAAKKERATIDTMTEKFVGMMNTVSDAVIIEDLKVTKENVMDQTRADLLAILNEEFAGKKMPRPPEAISQEIMSKLGESMKGVGFDETKPGEYIAKVKAEAVALLRAHPDVVREAAAADKEKGVETPLTEKELAEAKKLLSDGTLKQMREFLAKGDTKTQQELTKLWLGAQGFSIDDSVKEFKPENLTVANTHRVEGLGKLINMVVLAFTAIHLLKKKGEELKKKVKDGVADATGEGDKPAEGGADKGAESGLLKEKRDELLAAVKADGITKTLANRQAAIDGKKADVGNLQRTRDDLDNKAKGLEAVVQNLQKAPDSEDVAAKGTREATLATKRGELATMQENLKTAEASLTTAKEQLVQLNREHTFLKNEQTAFAKNKNTLTVARIDAMDSLKLSHEINGNELAGKLFDVLAAQPLGFDNDALETQFARASQLLEGLKECALNVRGTIPSSDEIGIDPTSGTVTNVEKQTTFLKTLVQDIVKKDTDSKKSEPKKA